jgi:hypothetical protein
MHQPSKLVSRITKPCIDTATITRYSDLHEQDRFLGMSYDKIPICDQSRRDTILIFLSFPLTFPFCTIHIFKVEQ